MKVDSDEQLTNAEQKLILLERHISKAKKAAPTPENRENVESLTQMTKQLRDEINRYRGQ